MRYTLSILVSAITASVTAFVVILAAPSWLNLYDLSVREAGRMGEQEILNRQIEDISRKLKRVFASQPDYPEDNLVTYLSGGTDRLEYTGFVPYVMPSDNDQMLENAKHKTAMNGLRYGNNGQELFSAQAGRILIQGKGDEFVIELPDCPQKLCLDRRYSFK